MSCEDSCVSPGIKSALNTLDHAYRLYGPNSVICSFNGGKDAVAILHLLRAAHAKHYNTTGEIPVRPRAAYFNNDDEFPDVLTFLSESVDKFDLDMIAFENGIGFSTGLEILVKNNFIATSSDVFPMAFVLGTRISDPNAVGQDRFSPSSHWMPPFMRVNPILDWDYGQVWHFLRLFRLPYCCLYDEGYTSLGTVKDTLPCPALALNKSDINSVDHESNDSMDNIHNEYNIPKFWPAYMLNDYEQERAGRIKKNKINNGESDARIINIGVKNSDEASSNNTITVEDEFTIDESLGTIDFDDYDSSKPTKTVGILVVGDEILKGLITDSNTKYAAKALRKNCLKLSRVVVISDETNEIANEIRRLRKEVDVLITSGGVGATHDDVTIKGVCEALNKKLVYNEEMAELIQRLTGNKDETESDVKYGEMSSAQRKMAMLPSNAKLRYLSKDEWPVLQCKNVFVLPGVPEFFEKKIENVATYLSSQLERSIAYKIVLSVGELSIVDVLNDVVERHPLVSIGSYPFVSHPEFKTVVTLEANLVDTTNTRNDASTTGGRFQRTNSIYLDRNAIILPKDIRDRNVRLALDDLIKKLPDESILRVLNEDDDTFDPF